ncbi:MAG: hypothetical protein QOF40_299 [Actinomycetota bacterium]|jgi:hypothetical protein|nr:hypothetical protein [Actinomycetota bacterium]
MSEQPTRPSSETREAERAEASKPAAADRAPTPEEEKIADSLDLDPDVAEHEREMIERGAHQKGEGKLP